MLRYTFVILRILKNIRLKNKDKLEMDTKLEGCLFFNNWDIVFRNVKSRDPF